MTKLKKLTLSQLNKIIDETKAEIKYRENVKSAFQEIQSILKKYRIDIKDIDLQALQKNGVVNLREKSTKSAKQVDQRRFVKPKYKDPLGNKTWTGRGRTPSWVLDICARDNTTVENFKKDMRFRCS